MVDFISSNCWLKRATQVYILTSLILAVYSQCPPQATGYFPDASDCTAYYQCTGGQIVNRFTCPQNLYWRVTFYGGGDCVQPSLVTCQTSPDGSTPSEILSFQCPTYLRPGRTTLNGYYGERVRCDSGYYLCVDSEPYRYDCPDGMLWSDSISTCDWTYRVPNCVGPVISSGSTKPAKSSAILLLSAFVAIYTFIKYVWVY